jgi:hypothetical protein
LLFAEYIVGVRNSHAESEMLDHSIKRLFHITWVL